MLAALSVDPEDIDYNILVEGKHVPKDAESFDTGGYTGDWGQEGRLAWLH
jgi:hypothetical protein